MPQAALLLALARVLGELTRPPDAAQQAALAVADRLAAGYAAAWPKQRAAAHAALRALLGALAPDQALLAGLLPRLVAALLAHTLRTPDNPALARAGALASPWLPSAS